jgi:hypothetical protein
MNHITDDATIMATLHRLNAIAKLRRLTLNAIQRDAREADTLESVRALIDRALDDLATTERNCISK